MARRPKRSALVLTISIFRLITVNFLINSITAADNSVILLGTNNNNHNENFNLNFPGQPKFGDRISPRHRQTSTNLSGGSSSSSAGTSGAPVYNNNNKSPVDNLNHSASNNHSVNLNKSSSSVTTDDRYSDSSSAVVNSDHDNDYRHHQRGDHHLLNSNNISSNVVIPVAGDRDHLLHTLQRPARNRDLAQHQHLRRNDDDDGGSDYSDLNNISKADRLIEMSTEFFIVPSSTAGQQKDRSPTVRPVLVLAARTPPSINSSVGSTIPPVSVAAQQSGLRKEPWVVPVLVLACISMMLMTAFEIFVLFKAWRTSPSRRHLFLGQMLLLGLFACSGLGALLTATPTILSCAIIRFGAGVAFALVFAALLVKCVFLISLNGGVYLPAPYQGLLLLFAVLIQVAIGTQWLMTEPPDIQTVTLGTHHAVTSKFSLLITSTDITRISTVIPLCKTQFAELLLSMIYIIFLIMFVAILAIKSRGIRDNYREATYIGLAIGGSIPIWLGWTLCGLVVADRHKDACLAFGLVATSATVFLVMFMPKGRQLAAMGKEGLYVEDREEQFSSLSRAGSGYSPSFFHFKPIKYGVMGAVPNSATNTGNATKHQSAAALGGDRVALVAAPPPSYTRMYHYFPAHMTQPFCFYPQPPPPPPLSPPPPPPPIKSMGGGIGGPPTLQHQQHQKQQSTPAQIAQTLRYPGLFMRPDETNLYTTLEPTLSSNPNVYFQRSGGVHPGMMY